MLVRTTPEVAGSNCANGGTLLSMGLDTSGNGALEESEVLSTGYVCNGAAGAGGATGAQGPTGSAGFNSLVAIVAEPAGANCANGGSKISSGLDTGPNGTPDGILQDSEVTTYTYTCNGAGISWVDVTGTAVQARANTGYVAHNDTAQVNITLPASLNFGDIVRVSGLGMGGWKIAQNVGQSINAIDLGMLTGASWTPRMNDKNRSWLSVASSADGSMLVAGEQNGSLYTSPDSGKNWFQNTPNTNGYWHALASSADGKKLVAGDATGFLYTSINSGQSWTPHMNQSSRTWYSVASSADGSTLVAVVSGGSLYISTNSGGDWTEHMKGENLVWRSVASSADGRTLVAGVQNGHLYTSTSSGATWTESMTDAPRNWLSITSSADGSKLVAGDAGGYLYTSTDSGKSWRPYMTDVNRNWYAFASSADGSKLAAATYNGYLYTSGYWTTLGTAGSISGGASDAIELQYQGNGHFGVLSFSGNFGVQ